MRLIRRPATTTSESKTSSDDTGIPIVIGEMSFECIESRLLALPPELRNNIWELVFTPDTSRSSPCRHGEVDLFDARSPPIHILLVCRQIYSEARGFYAPALSSYWRDTRFFLRCGEFAKQQTSKPLMERLSAIDENGIGKIQHLTICGPNDICALPTMQLHRGMWRRTKRSTTNPQTDVSRYLALVSKEFWNTAVDYRILHIRNTANLEATRGQVLICHLWITPLSDSGRGQDETEIFHVIKADCSDYNFKMLRVVNLEMGHEVLTKEAIRAAVRSHIQMEQQ